MASSVYKLGRVTARPLFVQVRAKSSRTSLGVRPENAPTLADRLRAINQEWEDPVIHAKVDIGFAVEKKSRREVVKEHVQLLKQNKDNKELELAARSNKLVIPLEDIDADNADVLTPIHAKAVAEHYAVYQHLFGLAYFHPVVDLQISFGGTVPVYRGNVVKPADAAQKPSVSFKSSPEHLWTLIMTTPDGTTQEAERIHWMAANIKGNDLSTGEELCNYIQPLPFDGLGYLRYVFVLYKQETLVDYSDLKKKLESTRFFSTLKFYTKRQELLTPAGLAFFVSDYDSTVQDYYQNVLKQEPPRFEYDFPDHYYKKQKWFPLKQPFNLYLDRYRDQKEIAKEYLVKKLKNTDPFKGNIRPKLPFPNAVPIPKGTPSWLTNEIKKERLGRARAADFL